MNEKNEKIRKQIIAIRDSGKTNMFDARLVMDLALESGYHELVDFIIEDSKAYSMFILTGKFPEDSDLSVK